jgi:SAM-dependent methyltransferase
MIHPSKSWFENWFDSPFYHKLYFNRNNNEAKTFLDKLMTYINLPKKSKLIDVACGKGRHATYLSSLGYDVTGVDLSANSIAYARQFTNAYLQFDVHDMRLPYKKKSFDGVFNFFTIFGCFDTDEENVQALDAMQQNLKDNGILTLDYLNQQYVFNKLIPEEEKQIDNTLYNIKKWADDDYFYKQIKVTDASLPTPEIHTEKVARITKEDFEMYFDKANLQITTILGNYALEAFDINHSPRIILIAKKKV